MLSEIDIRSMASDAAFERGRRYYQNGRVKRLEKDGEYDYYADVQGSRQYHVYLSVDDSGDVENFDCDCPAFETYGGPCKHIVATMFELMEHQQGMGSWIRSRLARGKKESERPSDAKRLLELFAPEKAVPVAPQAETHVHLVPRLFAVTEYRQISRWLEFRIGHAPYGVCR